MSAIWWLRRLICRAFGHVEYAKVGTKRRRLERQDCFPNVDDYVCWRCAEKVPATTAERRAQVVRDFNAFDPERENQK